MKQTIRFILTKAQGSNSLSDHKSQVLSFGKVFDVKQEVDALFLSIIFNPICENLTKSTKKINNHYDQAITV